MRKKTVLGLVLIVLGLGLIGFSMYINAQVKEGQSKVTHAQKAVDESKGLFSGAPLGNQLGKQVTSGAQHKINAGKEQIEFYSNLADLSRIVGIGVIAVGAGVLVIGKKKKR